MPPSQMTQFQTNSTAASKVIEAKAAGYNVLGNPRPAVTAYVAQHTLNEGTYPSLAALVRDIAGRPKERLDRRLRNEIVRVATAVDTYGNTHIEIRT